jgi:hypothetical protein
MKKQHLILITAGIMLGVLLLSKKTASSIDVIKPGDKGSDVQGLQDAFSNMTGVRVTNRGAYDKNTLASVQCLLKGTNALIDYDKGYVDRRFASDLYRIQNNAKLS